MKNKYLIILVLLILIAVGAAVYLTWPKNNLENIANNQASTQMFSPTLVINASSSLSQTASSSTLLVEPINNALSRVTKKFFGLKVSPGNSSVSPERFSGYHTGVDFETLPSEQDVDVPVYAVCSGPLKLKKSASGYGGVAVQACTTNGKDVTVVYGHLRLSSISAKVGQQLSAGEQLAVLGQGYSAETDGERKHLHLGVHRGTVINLLGYVQQSADLSQWFDPLTLF